MSKARLVVLISGSGSNLQALLDAIATGVLAAEIVAVIANRKAAYGLERAAQAGVPTIYFPLKPYRDDGRGREQYDLDLAAQIRDLRPDLIVLAGWMHIFCAEVINQFPRQMINLHPALPGQFNGANAIERAFEAYQRGEVSGSGCMVHYVIPAVDEGPVIAQRELPFFPDDTLESYSARLHEAEHELIVEAVGRAVSC